MNEFNIGRYIDISNFLSTLLGPDYEIIVYDLKHILHIVNGEISGRKSGDTISPAMKTILNRSTSSTEKWLSNYRALSGNGKILRCSTFYIKDTDNNLIGALNISFDDNRYKELSNLVFSLCHPDNYVSKNISIEIKETVNRKSSQTVFQMLLMRYCFVSTLNCRLISLAISKNLI